METTQWRAVTEIFDSAVELPVNSRGEFVQAAAGTDARVRNLVTDLLEADSKNAGFLEGPCFAVTDFAGASGDQPSVIQADEMISARFKVLRLVGTGGMGHVYEALDTELNVHVALKTIRAEIAHNPAILSQFRSEVRLARKITHPNVCRIFDLQHQSAGPMGNQTARELTYLTMEYLDGDNLQRRIKQRGALPSEQALHIARQMADALRAAHFTGVVHRDIKPANVMLVPSSGQERAVITDFGLARITVESGSLHSGGLSRIGGIIGTPAYMAPEQLRGGEVTAATDMYAFGLVLYEMLTGAQANLEALAQKENWLKVQPALAALPAPWRTTLEKCLQIRPQDRFQNADELVAFLDQSLAPRGKHFTRRQLWSAYAAIFVACVSLSLLGYRLYERGADARIAPGSTVLFSTIRNETGDKSFDNVTSLMQNQLTQAAHFNLLDADTVHNKLQQMTKPPDTPVTGAVAREIAMRAGAARVVSGAVSKYGNQYTLSITVQQPDNNPARALHSWQKQWTWQASSASNSQQIPPGLLSAVRDASGWVRREVGESAYDIERLDAPPEDVTTNNWNALAEYTEAQRLYADNKPEEAVASLRDAVQIDPQFALAWGRLGDILATTNQYAASYQAYSKALELDQARRLTRRERDRIKGSFASDTGDFEAAYTAFADMASFYPNDWLAWFYQARPLLFLGRSQEAKSVLLKAAANSPGNQYVLTHLVCAELVRGEIQNAQHWIAELRKAGHNDAALEMEGQMDFIQGDYPHARTNFTTLETSSDSFYSSGSYAKLARVAAEQGDLRTALDYINQGIEHDTTAGNQPEHDNKLLDRAYIECEMQEYSACLNDEAESLGKDVPPQRLRWTANLLSLYANAPGADRDAFLSALGQVRDRLPDPSLGPTYQLTTLQVTGLDELARGQVAGALETLHKADDLDLPTTPRDYLGRVLLAVAKNAPEMEKAALNKKAVQVFDKSGSKTLSAFQSFPAFPPGFFARQQACASFHCLALHRGARDAISSNE
jgi:serine/threonine protein kinase/Flp pilus assembly protein TadD